MRHSPAPAKNLSFDGYVLEPLERRLSRAHVALPIGPKAFDTLLALVERPGEFLSKDELISRVWPDAIVEENNLQVQISALRKILGRKAIATSPGRGYRFTLNIEPGEVSADSAGAAPTDNLPKHLTSFIGRDAEIAELQTLLGNSRLITLIGAGGCGKTRLSLQVASAARPAYADGVWFVELAALTDPSLIASEVARTLGVSTQTTDLLQAVVAHLRLKQVLLVLDNAEHLLAAAAEFVDAILRSSVRVVVLVTSRERLGLDGELTYRVPSLTTPPESKEGHAPVDLLTYDSVRLFIARAQLHEPDFAVTADNAPALAAICRRLDGIPLAIELAAPCIGSMNVGEISQRLDQRFRLLTRGSRAAMPRQRTLRSMIDWSYELLSSSQRQLLRRLSVFSGGWERNAAEQICTDDELPASVLFDHLAALVDKSLVTTEQVGATTRYGLLETVREYARERLAESSERERWQSRHLAYYADLAIAGKIGLEGPEQPRWLDRYEMEHDNLRAALAHSLTGNDDDATRGLALVANTFRYWFQRGHMAEGYRWARKVLNLSANAEGNEVRALVLNGAGGFAFASGNLSDSLALQQEGLAIYRTLGDHSRLPSILRNLALVTMEDNDLDMAQGYVEESVQLSRAIGSDRALYDSLQLLVQMATRRENFEQALALQEDCMAVVQRLGIPHEVDLAKLVLGGALRRAGRDLPRSASLLHAALASARQSRKFWNLAIGLDELAYVVAAQGVPLRGARLWGSAERLTGEIGLPLRPSEVAQRQRNVALARAGASSPEEFDAAWQEGRGWDWDEAVRRALQGTDES